MPSLSDAIQSAGSYAGEPAAPAPSEPSAPPPSDLQPGRNPMLRCPLPPLWESSPDSLRQFYVAGQVPQSRIFSPKPIPNSSTGGTTIIYAGSPGINTSGGGGGNALTTQTIAQAQIYAQQSVLTSPILIPGQSYQLTTPISNSFQLLSVASSTAIRFQMYSSAQSQTQDAARGLDDPPPAGVMQGIIADVALDTTPYVWNFANRVGANADTPQTNLVYATLTNLSPAPVAIVATIQYVPLATSVSPNSPQVTIAGIPLSTLDLGLSSGIVMTTGAQFSGPINAPIMNVTSAVGLQIQNSQISTINLADSDNIALLDDTNVFTGSISAPVINAGSSAGLTIAGSQISSVDLSDSTNIAYLDEANTFSGSINAPVVSVNSAAGLQVGGSQISSGTLSDASNLAYLSVSNTFNGPISAPVVSVATSEGLQVAGTQLASINLLDSGNLATLNGVNVFTNEVTAPQISATGSQANVFTGPVTSASFSSTSSTANVFTGPVTSAAFNQSGDAENTFSGNVNTVTINSAPTTGIIAGSQLGATAPGEMVTNGNFANGSTGWALGGAVVDTTTSYSGSASLKTLNQTSTQTIPGFQAGQTYLLQMWVQTNGNVVGTNAAGAGAYLTFANGTVATLASVGASVPFSGNICDIELAATTATPWTLIQITFVPSASGSAVLNLQNSVGGGTVTGTAWIDNVSITLLSAQTGSLGGVPASGYAQLNQDNTFTGSIGVLDINVSGGTVTNTFTAGTVTVNETINGVAPPVDPSADTTANRVSSFNLSFPGSAKTCNGGVSTAITSITFESSGTSDVVSLWASILATAEEGTAVTATASIDGGAAFGMGAGVLNQPFLYIGTISGIAAGSHTLKISITPTTYQATVSVDGCYGIFQQILSTSGFVTAPAGKSVISKPTAS